MKASAAERLRLAGVGAALALAAGAGAAFAFAFAVDTRTAGDDGGWLVGSSRGWTVLCPRLDILFMDLQTCPISLEYLEF